MVRAASAAERTGSAEVSARGGGGLLPRAALPTRSAPPNGPAAAAAPRRVAAGSARSALTHAAGQPAAASSRTVSASGSSRRAIITTRAPALASAHAMARPMPELPPVTRAVRPVSENSERKPGSGPGGGWAGGRPVGVSGLPGRSESGPGANERPGARPETAAPHHRLQRRPLVQPPDQGPRAERVPPAGPRP